MNHDDRTPKTEEELMDSIFSADKKWKNIYPVFYCSTCHAWSISCPNPDCNGSSCNASGCKDCTASFADFRKSKNHIEDYLTEDEKKTFDKIFLLKELIGASLRRNEYEIDWNNPEIHPFDKNSLGK